MLPQHAAVHPAVDRPEDHPDRAMQILQYATAIAAMVAAGLLAVLR